MKYIIVLIAFLATLGMTGCGYKEGVITTEQKSYLYFTGSVKNIKVSIDNGERFEVEEGVNHQYKISSGKHTVTIYRGNEMIVKREVFVGNSVAKEIEVRP